jgi:hypothetical protein
MASEPTGTVSEAGARSSVDVFIGIFSGRPSSVSSRIARQFRLQIEKDAESFHA